MQLDLPQFWNGSFPCLSTYPFFLKSFQSPCNFQQQLLSELSPYPEVRRLPTCPLHETQKLSSRVDFQEFALQPFNLGSLGRFDNFSKSEIFFGETSIAASVAMSYTIPTHYNAILRRTHAR